MTNPYFYTILLYAFMTVLGALDSSLTGYQIIPFANGLVWMRLHFITLGVMTQAFFLVAPIATARHANQPRPPVRWDIWALLNTGIIALIYGIPAINNNVILVGGTLVFIAVTLLMIQLWSMRKQGEEASPQKTEVDSSQSGRMFYIAGIFYLLFGIIVGTGIWMGWPALMRMQTPVEIHIHTNNWGFMALVFAGLTIDYYGRFTGHSLAGGKRTIDAVFWFMSIGALGLIFGPWLGGNLYIVVPGMLMHLTGTLILLWMMSKPLLGDRKAWTPGVWHMILSYIWLLMPVITSPIILLGVPGFDGAMAEANAPQALVYGWILQGAAAMTGYFYMRVFTPDRPAKLGGTWWTLLGFNAGGILLWLGIVKPGLFVQLQGGAYAVWTVTALAYGVSLLLTMKVGTEKEETSVSI